MNDGEKTVMIGQFNASPGTGTKWMNIRYSIHFYLLRSRFIGCLGLCNQHNFWLVSNQNEGVLIKWPTLTRNACFSGVHGRQIGLV